jgi:hypothetical protein
MQQIPPNPKKTGSRPAYRTPPDANASLFTDKHPVVGSEPHEVTRRTERGARIAGDMKRAIFFSVVLVFVAIVLYQFVSATLL